MRRVSAQKWIGSKWRPRLATIVVAILIMVMALPLVGLFFFRLYENQLIRQTEAELIAQGAALAAIYAQEVRDAGIPAEKLGAAVPAASASDPNSPYRPIEPRLDLASDSVQPTRPAATAAAVDPAFAAV
ncbi:two-component sensor histidine kinase, partial [Mesorhizobium sp. M6A.T.Ca.TU.002.02.2.1]